VAYFDEHVHRCRVYQYNRVLQLQYTIQSPYHNNMRVLGRTLEEEAVPSDKVHRPSTRDNSAYKWHAPHCIGALEIPCEPDLQLQAEYIRRDVDGGGGDAESDNEAAVQFKKALELWNQLNGRDQFLTAAQSVPVETCCCGLVPDDKGTMQTIVETLQHPHDNKKDRKSKSVSWVKQFNKQLQSHQQSTKTKEDDSDNNNNNNNVFSINLFLWKWENVLGQGETDVLMIRFFSKPPKAASQQHHHQIHHHVAAAER
jgi:hypothetical protein